ncbi:MAG: hypothetical protein ACP5R5_10915 [Armatimonadota bacterium]
MIQLCISIDLSGVFRAARACGFFLAVIAIEHKLGVFGDSMLLD